jgi:GTP:adenosylcobinamide-phosphate guanylyltransferase
MSGNWTTLLLAGSRPGGDPLTASLGVAHKPLLPLAGEPMILRPLRALLASPEVASVRILTQDPALFADLVRGEARVTLEQSGATIAATLLSMLDDPETRYPMLVTTADHALLTPAMVADFTGAAAGADLAVGFVSRTVMLARFPQAQRTWLRIGRERYSGANLFAIGSPKARTGIERWRAIEQDRKKGWRVLLQFGAPLLLASVLRLRDLHQTSAALGRRLGLSLRAVELSDATAAIDVDKPADHALVTAIIEGHA